MNYTLKDNEVAIVIRNSGEGHISSQMVFPESDVMSEMEETSLVSAALCMTAAMLLADEDEDFSMALNTRVAQYIDDQLDGPTNVLNFNSVVAGNA